MSGECSVLTILLDNKYNINEEFKTGIRYNSLSNSQELLSEKDTRDKSR